LRRGGCRDRDRHDLEGKKDNKADRNIEIIATIIEGTNDKEWNAGYWKAQIQKLNQVIATKKLKPLVGPSMTFGPEDIRPMQTPHIEALVLQLKIATAMIR